MASSRRDLAILIPIEATFRNFTHTHPHYDVLALAKKTDFAPSNLGTAEYNYVAVDAAHLRRRMARSPRDLAILAPIGATFRNISQFHADLAIWASIGATFRYFTPSNRHHDVFAVGKVADFAPSNLITGV